jgi:hypothetical protein
MMFISKEGLEMHIKTVHLTEYPCSDCNYKTKNTNFLAIHKEKMHSEVRRNRDENQKYSFAEKKANGPCHFWNYGTCRYGEDKCKFLHREIPACTFQERCRDVENCRFFHFATKTTRFRGFLRKERAAPPTGNRWGRGNQ